MAVMPMFPLGTVLLPGAVLPLHVFEPRYRALVRDCLESSDHEFGVVLIERGFEVGGGDIRSNVGTVARMMQVAELDDGRYAVVCIGTRRIKVVGWLPDDPYPLADVDDWPDDESGTDDLGAHVDALRNRVRRASALALELGDSVPGPVGEMRGDALVDSYHLVAATPVGPADTYRLLCAGGPAARLEILAEVLDDLEAALEFRLQGPTSPE
ncbi:MAG: LON peptidase substrate-binding domain-containing protein [Actinobacteria bacterium]|nr:LON peptidase substrate-binding domain-containing protein [Actinomycetota bacterium]